MPIRINSNGGNDDDDKGSSNDGDGSDDESDLSAYIGLISQRQVLGGLRHAADAAMKAAQVTAKVFRGDTRQIGTLLALQTAVDFDTDFGVRVRRGDDRGRALHALHRRGARTAYVTQSRWMMMRQFWTADRMALERHLIVGLDAGGLLRPQQLDLHLIDDVVEAVQIRVRQSVLHRVAAFALQADRVAGVAHGKIQQTARHQNGVLHLAHGPHELLHAVQDARVAELRLVVPGDPPQTPSRIGVRQIPVVHFRIVSGI